MRYCYFVFFEFDRVHPDSSGQAPVAMGQTLACLKGLTQALVHTPLPADTPHAFADDPNRPDLAWQLYADQPEDMEAWLTPDGALNQALPGLLAQIGTGGGWSSSRSCSTADSPQPKKRGSIRPPT